jgi:hypothetical protein
VPWSGLPAGLLSGIAGLGGLASGYNQGQDQALQRAIQLQRLQEQQKQEQIKRQIAQALFGAGAQQPLAPVNQGVPQPSGGGMPAAQPSLAGIGQPQPQQQVGQGGGQPAQMAPWRPGDPQPTPMDPRYEA